MDGDAPTVGIVGSGPAVESIVAAVADTDGTVDRIDPDAAPAVDLPVVVAPTDDAAFGAVDRAVSGPSWIAVELGGIGGVAVPTVDAAVSVLAPDGGCYACLSRRVRATVEAPPADDPRVSRSDARFAGAIAGRLVARTLVGDVPAGRVVELPYVERRLLPVPGCSCAQPRDRSLSRDVADPDLETVVARAEQGIDERIGIVESVGEGHSYPAPYYLATLADTSGFSDATAGPLAAGVATDWNAAYMKAVGEALERYCAGVYRAEAFRHAPADAIANAVPPDRFVRPPDFPDPEPDASIAWVPGEALASGESTWLPAEFVHFPPPTREHTPAITTGLGLGASGGRAILSGLYEVVERDATMLAWFSTFEPLGLAIEEPAFDALARRAGAEGLTVTPLLVTQDVDVPVVSVAVHREGPWPRFAVGSGASLDPVRAARAALEEALQNWMELREMGPDRAEEESTAIGRYASFPPEAEALVSVDAEVDVAAVGSEDPPAGAAELEALIDRVTRAGLTPYAASVSTRDVAALGFEAVRVLVPEAQPLFTDERYFGDRAKRVPRDLGYRPRLDRPPHPYP